MLYLFILIASYTAPAVHAMGFFGKSRNNHRPLNVVHTSYDEADYDWSNYDYSSSTSHQDNSYNHDTSNNASPKHHSSTYNSGSRGQWTTSGGLQCEDVNYDSPNESDSERHSSSHYTPDSDSDELAIHSTLHSCNQSQEEAIREAVKHAQELANYGIWGVKNKPDKILEYFKTDDDTDKKDIGKVFRKVYDALTFSSSGSINIYCYIPQEHYICDGETEDDPVYAYTKGAHNKIILCNSFFKQHVSGNSMDRHFQEGILLHEMTHIHSIKGTTDYAAYGVVGIKRLTREQRLDHADSYTFFAKDVKANY